MRYAKKKKTPEESRKAMSHIESQDAPARQANGRDFSSACAAECQEILSLYRNSPRDSSGRATEPSVAPSRPRDQRLPDGGRRERFDLHAVSALRAMGFGAESGWQVERVDRSAILSQPKMTEPRVVAQQRDHF